jgi:hypothetical protein
MSCSRHTPDHAIVRLIPEGFTDFSDVNVNSVKLFEFENPEDGFLGFIHKAVGHDGNYYLINHTGEFLELLKYNNDGSYVKRIGGIGRGPSEYISASDFAIEHPTGNILVINHSNEILKYSRDGEFVGEVQTGIMSSSFELATEGLFFRYHGKPDDYRNQVISVSNSQGVMKAILHETHYESGQIAEINFYRDGDNVYFREVFDNKIYRINEESAVPVIEFDFGDFNYNPEFASMDILSIYEEMVLKGSFLAFPGALITNEWIYAFFSNEKDQIGYHILYNSFNGEYKSFRTTESTGMLNAHLLDETGSLGFFITGTSLKGLFNDMQLTGFTREDITEDSTWLLWLTI